MLALTHLPVTIQVILTLHAAAHSGSVLLCTDLCGHYPISKRPWNLSRAFPGPTRTPLLSWFRGSALSLLTVLGVWWLHPSASFTPASFSALPGGEMIPNHVMPVTAGWPV